MPRVSKGTRINRHHKPTTLPVQYRPGFMDKMDGRLEITKVLHGRFTAICEDMGGEATLSHLQRALVERAVFLQAVLEDMELQLAEAKQSGDAEAITLANGVIGKWTQALNAFVGLCAKLGLERVVKSIDLQTYVNANGAGGCDDK